MTDIATHQIHGGKWTDQNLTLGATVVLRPVRNSVATLLKLLRSSSDQEPNITCAGVDTSKGCQGREIRLSHQRRVLRKASFPPGPLMIVTFVKL